MGSVTGASEVYDGLGRRVQSTGSGGDTLTFLHDGGSVLGWLDSLGNYWDFLNLPGGGALAGSNTVSGTTTTWVPLIDASGSTIALVNGANVDSPPATTFTYDPFGSTTVSGSPSTYPFQYQGLEKELTDPGPLYYTGGGQYYSPQIMRSPSETSQTSSSGTGGGQSGSAISAPSGDPASGLFSPNNYARNAEYEAGGAAAGFLAGAAIGGEIGSGFGPVGAVIGGAIGAIAGFFEGLFGGGSSTPPTPRQLLSNRHPLYDWILEIRPSETPTEGSSAPTESEPTAPSTPCNPPPLQQIVDNTSDGPGNAQWCQARCTDLALERGINRDKAPDQSMWFYRCYNQCMGTGDYPEWRPYFPRNHNTVPDSSSNFQVPKISPWWAVIPILPALGEAAAAAFGL